MPRNASTRPGYPAAVVERTLDLLDDVLRRRRRRPLVVGLSGLQGSGKSTFAAQLARAASARGRDALVLSLDDFYLGRRERLRLARDVHPLLATRGVPGTHDVDLLLDTLAALGRASARAPVALPRFDKGRDTRMPPSRWRRVTAAPALVVLEGWCIGVPREPAARLRVPVNALERDEDRDARWRRWVDAQLGGGYARLDVRLDALVLLEAPSFAVVERWRDEQERALRRRGAVRAMDLTALRRFLMHYERLSRYALVALPRRADLRVILDERRAVRRIARGRAHRRAAQPSCTARRITPANCSTLSGLVR